MAELVVALDFKDSVRALSMARSLRGVVSWMKVGLELFKIGRASCRERVLRLV